jgi:AcrR family transcriptional regulator
VDAAILAAGWRLLSERGYEGVTIEAVAERAGCSRPALYRRYSNKRALILGLVDGAVRLYEPPQVADAAPDREIALRLSAFVEFLAEGGIGVVLGLSEARRRDPDLSALLDEQFARERVCYVQALQRAVAPPPSLSRLHIAVDAMVGAVLFRCALRGAELTGGEINLLVQDAIAGLRASSPMEAAESGGLGAPQGSG